MTSSDQNIPLSKIPLILDLFRETQIRDGRDTALEQVFEYLHLRCRTLTKAQYIEWFDALFLDPRFTMNQGTLDQLQYMKHKCWQYHASNIGILAALSSMCGKPSRPTRERAKYTVETGFQVTARTHFIPYQRPTDYLVKCDEENNPVYILDRKETNILVYHKIGQTHNYSVTDICLYPDWVLMKVMGIVRPIKMTPDELQVAMKHIGQEP